MKKKLEEHIVGNSIDYTITGADSKNMIDGLLGDEKPSLKVLESKRVANKVKQKYGNAIRKLGSI